MSFNRKQLANASGLDDIAAVAMQTGDIDTQPLTAADRLSLLLVLNQDITFKSKHRAALVELAEEVKADRGKSPHPSAASVAVPHDGNKSFSSQEVANSEWAQNPLCSRVTARQVIGDHPQETCLSLDYALWVQTSNDRLGTELRLIVPVWLDGAWQKLPVLMKWETRGVAAVRLVSTKAVRSQAPPKPVELVNIIKDQGITVADLASWSAPQLREFAIAVRLMVGLDRHAVGAMTGIVLEHTKEADDRLVNPHAAHYRWDPMGGTNASILIRQQAFDEDATRFVGSTEGKLHCNSTMIIAHELGHVVENYDYRRVWDAKATCVKKRDDAYLQFTRDRDRYLKTVGGTLEGLLQHRQSAIAAREACAAKKAAAAITTDKVFKAYNENLRDPEKSALLNKLCNEVEAAERACADNLSKATDFANAIVSLCDLAKSAKASAVLDFNEVAENLQQHTKLQVAIKNAKLVVSRTQATLGAHAQQHPSIKHSWTPLGSAMVAASTPLHQALDELNSAAESVSKVDTLLGTVVCRTSTGEILSTRRLQNFVDFVGRLSLDARQRVIGITPYAQRSWPQYPRELFAEAYAMWLTDAPRLTSVAPELTDYFATGKHVRHAP